MIKRILVGLGDVAYSKVATQYAISLAKQHGGRLTGVTLFDVDRLNYTGPVPIGGVVFYGAISPSEKRILKQLKQTLKTTAD